MVREFQFYIVPTPIGNIQDITYRAIEVLKEVDLIACEDTRNTQKLLNHYDIKTKCISYHKYNEKERVQFFLDELSSGKRIALVSDAGTPMICDPGEVIIDSLIKNHIAFTALPGACALTTFLSQVPRKDETFTFIGFIPRTEKQIAEVVQSNKCNNLVFYESPERILKTLEIIKKIRGNVNIGLGRELSKLFEEVNIENISNVLEHYKDGIKGEIVCMIYADEIYDDCNIDDKIRDLKSKNFRDKDIAVILSTLYKINKNEVYKRVLEIC